MVSVTHAHTDLDDAIALLQTELNRLDRSTAEELGVGNAEDLQMLRLLGSKGPLRIGHLATIRSAGKATVSARVDRLERKGLVVRGRDPVDRRAVTVTLTELGEQKATASRTTRSGRLGPIANARRTGAVLDIVAVLSDHDG